MIENIREELWDVLEESKKDTQFNAEIQEDKLHIILEERYSREDIDLLANEFYKIQKEYIDNDDFELLHMSEGGIVNGGDDHFYSDFASWLVGQGEELYEDFCERGNTAILVYIINNDVPRRDFEHECLEYAFLDYSKIEQF